MLPTTMLVLSALTATGTHATTRQEDPAPAILHVVAASSLQNVIDTEGRAWARSRGAEVRFSYDASSRLATQIQGGLPVDVVITADRSWMDWLVERGLVAADAPHRLAQGSLVVVVPADDRTPAPTSLSDLSTRGDLTLALASENVPAGRYADQALAGSGVASAFAGRIVRGGSVRSVLEWVARGEVDAAIVYASDARSDRRVRTGFVIDAGSHAAVEYWIAARTQRGAPFVAHLLGPEAQAAFRVAGFQSATDPPDPVPVQFDEGASAPSVVLPSTGSAVGLSVMVALLATLLATVPAIGLGWLLARRDFAGKSLVTAFVMAPLVIPPVVTGFLLLWTFGSSGPLGALLSPLGLRVPFTWIGAVVAAVVVGFPLYVMSVRGAFEGIDPEHEDLARSLGAPPRRAFFRVALPLALPGVAAGMVLSFARALGEFGATIVLAGNIEGETRTIALAVYTLLEAPGGGRGVWMLVGASVLLSVAALAGFELLSRRQRAHRRGARG